MIKRWRRSKAILPVIVALAAALTLSGCDLFGGGSGTGTGAGSGSGGKAANGGQQRPGANGGPNAGGGANEPAGPGNGTDAVSDGNGGAGAKPPADPIQAQLDKMSLDEKLGQMVMAGVDGIAADAHSKALAEQYHVGGYILLKHNVNSTAQMLKLVNDLKADNARAGGIPLFLGIDEEGGRITRLPQEFHRIPTNAEIGRVDNGAFSREIGGLLGEEVRAFGMNVDFAPVLDINSNPDNPVIGDRSFGDNAELVSRLGVETMKGIQSQRIIPAVKHFPGHGDTSVDSHLGLPVVQHDLERLSGFELVPFQAAVDNGADMVMIAHILLPQIDAAYPSSMSKAVITGLLRDRLRFDGVVITDDMTMGAITKTFDIAEAAVASINAGSDIVLVCHGFSLETSVLEALRKAAADGTISKDRIDQSVKRILRLKQQYKLADTPVKAVDPERINAAVDHALKRYIQP